MRALDREMHPIADKLPLLEGQEYQDLVADIRTNGLIEAIWLDGEQRILDGRNRYRACLEAGVEPRFRTWNGEGGSELAFIIAMNLERRHLTPWQKACLAGEMLPSLEKEAAARRRATQNNKSAKAVQEKIPEQDVGQARDKAAAIFGVNPRYISDAKRLKATEPELYAEMRAGKLSIADARRAIQKREREEERAQNRALIASFDPMAAAGKLNHQFQTIILDPPWCYDDGGNEGVFGRAFPRYATMKIDEIADERKVPVRAAAAPNAHIYLWIINRKLPTGVGVELLQHWGFRYIETLTWCKPSIGLGMYYRSNTEHVLFGVRGDLPLLRNDCGTWFEAPRLGRHSEKPPEFYQLVETCSPGPWIEFFARKPRRGWATWGAEAPGGA